MVSITDSTNRIISFTVPPQRVVCLIPSITETLFDLGIGGSVAGISKFCIHPADCVRNKTKVGGPKDPDLAKIRSIDPDLIIMNLEENKPEHIKELSARYKTWVTYPRSLRDAGSLLDEIGKVFGVEAKADTYAEKIKDSDEKARSESRRKTRTLYLIWRDPWMTINRDTFIHDVMEHHHLDNIFAGHSSRYFEITEKEIETADPEVILLPDEPYRFKEKHIADFSHIRVSAVKNKRIFIADGTYFCWYGTRTAKASEYIQAHILSRINH